jgi:multiple sugar transport system ATP-binding protein
MNFVTATVVADNGAHFIEAGDFRLRLPASHVERVRERVGQKVIFGVRPDDIYDRSLPLPAPATPGNSARLTVDVTEPMGASVYAYLASGRHTIVAELDSETAARDGQPLEVMFDMDKTHIFDPETEQALI